MKQATKPSDKDFQSALESLFPKYLESAGFAKHPAQAYMLDGHRLMGGSYRVSYSSFLAEKCETLFSAMDDDAIDCMKYLAKDMECIMDVEECTEERYEELCRNGKPILHEKMD